MTTANSERIAERLFINYLLDSYINHIKVQGLEVSGFKDFLITLTPSVTIGYRLVNTG